MKNVVGAPARKESFFQRENEVKRIMQRIVDGNNLQIAAPRRVGKTSILFSLLDKKVDDNIYVYTDTEAINNSEDFFKKLLKEILKAEDINKPSMLGKLFKKGNRFLEKINSIDFGIGSLEFKDTAEAKNYKEEVENLLCGISLESNRKLVLMIDEFPQTVQNIIDLSAEGKKKAIEFLQLNRDLRLNSEINGKVIFVYTGSIGLNHTVSSIEAMSFINDINSIEIGPLTGNDPYKLLDELLKAKKLKAERDVAEYLMSKIEWLIPFHIQLAVQEIISITYENPNITIAVIDQAFNNIIASRNNNHFEHYSSRLKRSFKGNSYQFASELLHKIASENIIDKGNAFDLAVKHNVQDQFRNIIEILSYDGYINNNSSPNQYRFNSPILRMWWERANS